MVARTKRGISSIVGTLLVLAVTVTTGALLYLYSQGLFNNVTHKATVPINVQMYVESPSIALVNVEVENPTNEPIQITQIGIFDNNGVGGWNNANFYIPPGKSMSFTYTAYGKSFAPGNEYFITFNGVIGDQAFSETVDVISQGWQG